MPWIRFLIALFLTSSAQAATLKLQVVDASGAPFPKVLVILKSLEGGGEISRELTDNHGRIPAVSVGEGLYRIIATCPYGLCETTVREFLGARLGSEMVITLPMLATDSVGEVVGAPTVKLVMTLPDGRPASGVHVLVRDLKAKREKWYVADQKGSATIELRTDPVVLLAVYGGILFTRQINAGCAPGSRGPICTGIDTSTEVRWQF